MHETINSRYIKRIAKPIMPLRESNRTDSGRHPAETDRPTARCRHRRGHKTGSEHITRAAMAALASGTGTSDKTENQCSPRHYHHCRLCHASVKPCASHTKHRRAPIHAANSPSAQRLTPTASSHMTIRGCGRFLED